jgi:hypothetical protein
MGQVTTDDLRRALRRSQYAAAHPSLDSYGKEIGVGDFVAYNRSGNVMCGWVTYIPKHRNVGAITVKERDTGKESHVRNRMGILILEKADVPQT